jgi:hypothetical protein
MVAVDGQPHPDRPPPYLISDIMRLPGPFLNYLAHTVGQLPIRALARAQGRHASTVLRQVRQVETRRDDPLVDELIDRSVSGILEMLCNISSKEELSVMLAKAADQSADVHPKVEREARRILRRLCERNAFLAVAPEMEKAVVMREVVPGKHNRIAVVDRTVAHVFALQDWIACTKNGRIACYSITTAGRAALKRLLAEDKVARGAAVSPFQEQHREYGERLVMEPGENRPRSVRYNLAESPLTVLGRKADKTGVAYLAPVLIEAGERLREDFEIAQIGPRVTQNWERFLSSGDRGNAAFGPAPSEGSQSARDRVAAAMKALGPGLSDIVFRVCCFLEGLEAAEKRLGWSARSGKIVLRIALERLAAHYGLARGDEPMAPA